MQHGEGEEKVQEWMECLETVAEIMSVDVDKVMRDVRAELERDILQKREEEAQVHRNTLLELASLKQAEELLALEEFVGEQPATGLESRVVGDFLHVDGHPLVVEAGRLEREPTKIFSTGRRVVVVAEDGIAIGLVAQYDILCRAVCNTDPNGQRRVEELLSRDVVKISSTTNILEALDLMDYVKSLNMEVVDSSGGVLGAIHVPSILRALAESRGSTGRADSAGESATSERASAQEADTKALIGAAEAAALRVGTLADMKAVSAGISAAGVASAGIASAGVVAAEMASAGIAVAGVGSAAIASARITSAGIAAAEAAAAGGVASTGITSAEAGTSRIASAGIAAAEATAAAEAAAAGVVASAVSAGSEAAAIRIASVAIDAAKEVAAEMFTVDLARAGASAVEIFEAAVTTAGDAATKHAASAIARARDGVGNVQGGEDDGGSRDGGSGARHNWRGRGWMVGVGVGSVVAVGTFLARMALGHDPRR